MPPWKKILVVEGQFWWPLANSYTTISSRTLILIIVYLKSVVVGCLAGTYGKLWVQANVNN